MAGYGDDAGFTAWAIEAGLTVPAGSIPAARQRGAVFIDGYEPRFPGVRSGGYDQERAWGRDGAVTRYGQTIPDGVIPIAIVTASYYAAFEELTTPGSLSPVVLGSDTIKREKVGTLEVEYAVGSNSEEIAAMSKPSVTAIDALLFPFLISTNYPVLMVV